jgi:chromosome segregation ATPase
MKIELKQLTLHNFKGAKDLTINFSSQTEISGANATGKTRIFDAFTWCLFGKDSEDKKDFNIKTLDINNEALHRADHSVKALLSIDDMDSTLERIYKEKWVKKRGEENQEFAGHETTYFVNGVPLQQKEYQEKVENIIHENLFKQITNPGYFNSMKWNDRREMLFSIAGSVRDSDIVSLHPDLKALLDMFSGKTFEGFKRELSAKKKLLKESLLNIPARIDEVNRAIVPEPDYVNINADILKNNTRISEIDTLIQSAAKKFDKKNQENQAKQNRIFEAKQQISKLEFEDRTNSSKENNDLKLKQNRLADEITWFNRNTITLNSNLLVISSKIQTLTEENNNLRTKWTEFNEESLDFANDQFSCPACNRPFEADDIEVKKAEMTANFNKRKQTELQKISNSGTANKNEIKRLSQELSIIQDQINNEKQSILDKQKEVDAIIVPEVQVVTPNSHIKVLQDEITELEKQIEPLKRTDNTELVNEKNNISVTLDSLKKQLTIKESNEKHRARIQELNEQLKSLSQQIANLEKQEFQCEKFTRAKINMVEEKINSLFSFVKFKMFSTLVNGGIEEVCDTLINGVPYQDANNAAKINAGIDIINTLSKHYDIYAPIFVDNAEAVNEIFKTDSQMIKLFVTTDKELIIKN